MDSPDPFHINAKVVQVRTIDFIKLYPHNDTTKTTSTSTTGMWALTLESLVNKLDRLVSVLLNNEWKLAGHRNWLNYGGAFYSQ